MRQTKKILLVEDNPDHAFLEKSGILISGNYEVGVVSTGEAALKRLAKEKYDIALLDYNLPDIDGLTVLREITERNGNVPVVMITGLGSEVIAVAAMKMGAYDYVIKSEDSFRLLPLMIDEVLEKCRLARWKEEKAAKDLLTGTYNRNHFQELYAREVEAAKRYGRKLALAMIDVNELKAINDTYGHVVGDQVLIHLGSLLKKSLRRSDIVARYGGDEFVAVMMETGSKKAEFIIERIRKKIERFNSQRRLPTSLSVSIGISCSDNNNYENLLEEADKEMYKEKKLYYQRKSLCWGV